MTARWVILTIFTCLVLVVTHMAKISELDARLDAVEQQQAERDAGLLRNDRAVRQLQCVTLKVCTDEGNQP